MQKGLKVLGSAGSLKGYRVRAFNKISIKYSLWHFTFAAMLKFIIWAVVIYLIYKFVFELLVPVSKAATQMQDKIKEMQKAQQQQAEQQKTQQATTVKPDTTSKGGEYIDYEEVK